MKKSLWILLVLVMCLSVTVFAAGSGNLKKSLAIDVSGLKADDGQALLQLSKTKTVLPKKPTNAEALPETDPLHWYNMEYAGWDAKKVNIPKSPKDGALGKKVIVIVHGDHPWTTAYIRGAKKVADAYKMQFKALSPNWDLAVQNQMIDQAITEKPDMIILIAIDAKTAVQQARRINQAGIPLILSNTLTQAEAMNYSIAWTGPNDFGQFRILSKLWADKLGKKGGVAYVQHAPGGSPYYARCWGPISELSKYAPEIKTLDKQAPGFEADKTMQLVSDWLTRFGKDLKGICAADDSAQALGIAEALKKAGRTDIVVVAAGNSKVGMDAVKAGNIYAITYQTAEGDGALGIKTAADWFNGKKIEPVRYLPMQMITKDNVDQFYPPQW